MHSRQKRLVAANRRRSSVWRWMLSVSISPVLAIVLCSVWNQAGTAQESPSGTGKMPVVEGGQDAHPTNSLIVGGTGKMPVVEGGQDAHPTNRLIVGGTGILPVAIGGTGKMPVVEGGQDAHPTNSLIVGGTGILPVAIGGTGILPVAEGGQDAHPTNSLIVGGTGILPVAIGGTGILPVAEGGQDAHPTNRLIVGGTGVLPVAPNNTNSELKLMTQSIPPASRIRQGHQVSLNGRILPLAWTQQPTSSTSANFRTWIADVGLMQSAGVDLLNTADSTKQPVQWFSVSLTEAQSLTARATGPYRYLDVTDFAKLAGWQISIDSNVLKITSQAANVTGIRQAEKEWGDRIVLDLDRPAPWQVNFVDTPSPSPTPAPKDTPDDPTKPAIPQPRTLSPANEKTPDDPTKPALSQPLAPAAPIAGQEWSIAIDAKVDRTFVDSLRDSFAARTFATSKQLLSLKVEPAGNQTRVRVTIPLGWRPQVFSLGNPNRLVIDIRPDSLVEKDLLWAPGVRWRQQYQKLGTARFPVFSLEVNPRQSGVKVRPLLSNPPTDKGSAPLLQTAELSGTAAAINAGFFNRINRLALGAIRRDNKWLSGPILNRGAIAWNERGEFVINRLTLQETLIIPGNQRLSVSQLNSAYVESGIGRYNPDWGATYTPFSDDEIVVTVADNRVVSQSPGGAAGKTNFPIPGNGYILALRADLSPASQLAVGTLLRLETNTIPADFNRFPYILGGGPVLVQNSRVALDAKAEGFSDAYVRQTAIRSAIGRTAAGNLLIVAVHNRAGGAGPNFAELAQILQQMGAVEALNLDGGSSTSLYLGGSLLDRPPSTAARVHNAIGIFIQP